MSVGTTKIYQFQAQEVDQLILEEEEVTTIEVETTIKEDNSIIIQSSMKIITMMIVRMEIKVLKS